ncbi:MAG: sodium:proton antiporter [Candidatus Poribacteria bacterium]|nr:MAG: sodium:proton antiporter [Candidatus Poribacteria bacterium]
MSPLGDRWRLFVRLLALGSFGLCLLLPAPSSLPMEAWIPIRRSLGIFVLCLILWVFDALPLMVTSLLPLILFPLLGVLSPAETYRLFGNEVIFFLLGVFILASLVIRSGLSNRLAWTALRLWGRSPRRLLAATLLLPAFGSFWMSEHAVVAMLFPVVLEIANVLDVHERHPRYGKGLFLALAWGSVIGGVATFLGGGRAPLAVNLLRNATGLSVGFLQWMVATLPVVLVLLGVALVLLLRVVGSDLPQMAPIAELLETRRQTLGRMDRTECGTALLMLLTVGAWIAVSEPLGGLAGVALLSCVVAFALGWLEWNDVEEDVNWGVLLMYGGAVTLGYALRASGAAAWMASAFFGDWVRSPALLIGALSLAAILLTSAMSNAAVVALLTPIALSQASSPEMAKLVTISVAVPAGLAFALPMATPAIALAYSSGLLTMRDTVATGAVLMAVSWVVFNLAVRFWFPLIEMAPAWS